MKQENSAFPYASAHCQPRSGSRPSSAALVTSHISQLAFLTAPQLNSFLVHPHPQETALTLFRGIAAAFHLHKALSQQQLQAIAHVQNEEWLNTRGTVRQQMMEQGKGKDQVLVLGSSKKTTIFFFSQSSHLKHKARSNTFHSYSISIFPPADYETLTKVAAQPVTTQPAPIPMDRQTADRQTLQSESSSKVCYTFPLQTSAQ